MKPRAHQEEAVQAVVRGFKENSRGQVYMACASGKTLVSLWAAEKIKAKKTLVLLPSLALVRQTLLAYRGASIETKWASLAVCSDSTVYQYGDLGVKRADLDCPVTEDVTEIAEFLEQPGMRIVFCTYQSAEKLKGIASFDLAVFDEAHKTAGEQGKQFSFCLHDDNVDIKRRLFLTATPRHEELGEDGAELVYSMDDEAVYGPVFYSLSFRQAVDLGIICDYKVVISVLLEKDLVDETHQSAIQTAVVKAMNTYSINKVFSYHHTIQSAERFVEDNKSLFRGIKLLHINGEHSVKLREETMEIFRSSKRALLTNARCLSEGVDVPSVDMVAFTQPKSSTIDIIQTAGRAMRKSLDRKERGYIFIPVFLREQAPGETLEDAVSRTHFDHVYAVLQALKESDDVLAAAIDRVRDHVGSHGDEEDDLLNIDIDTDLNIDLKILRRAIAARIVDSLTQTEKTIVLRKKALLERAAAGLPRPSQYAKTQAERTLANCLTHYASRKASSTYDKDFSKLIREKAPLWFTPSSDLKKTALLELAASGGAKPTSKDHKKMYEMLRYYTMPGHRCYDEAFHEEVKGLRPDWLMTASERTKAELLEMAKKGKPKPSRYSKDMRMRGLGDALHKFCRPTSSARYDDAFARELYRLAPDWFSNYETLPFDRVVEIDGKRFKGEPPAWKNRPNR